MSDNAARLKASLDARIQKSKEAERAEKDETSSSKKRGEEGEEEERRAGDDDEEVVLMEEEAEEKKDRPLSNYLDTEEDEQQWSTERDEAAEAAEVEAQLSGTKKKRRLQKLADVEHAASNPTYRGMGNEDEDDDDFVVDDLGGYDKDDDFGVKRDKKLMESIQLQKPFQPSSTTQEQGGRKRFLAWNAIGSISSTEQESSLTVGLKVHTIEMIYNDTSKLKASKFRDFFNFKVAALGAHGAVFASAASWDKQDKKEIPSTVFFRPSDTWDTQSSSEWQLQMDLAAKEEAELVAIGDTWVAVATNKQYVRLISHSGIQRFILSLNGPIVSMVGNSNLLALVYHDGIPLPGHQNLGLIVMDVVKQKEIYRGKCVISPRSKLTWLGYSDIGMLVAMDSFGVIRALCKSWDWQWAPVLDTNMLKKPGSSDVYWPVSLIDDKMMCILLRNGVRQPPVVPRPALIPITLQLPFLDLANNHRIAQAEENHARYELLWYNDEHGGMSTASRFFTSKQETVQDKLILGLFQKALSLDRSSRALDLCTMLHKKKALEIAVQMATHAKKTALVGRITMLIQVKFPAVTATASAASRGLGRDDDEGLSAFLDGTPTTATSSSKKGTLRKANVSFDLDDAEEENRLAALEDDGEAEFGAPESATQKSSLKRKFDDTPASTPLAQLSTSTLNVKKVMSANVKPKEFNAQKPTGAPTANGVAQRTN